MLVGIVAPVEEARAGTASVAAVVAAVVAERIVVAAAV